MAKKITEEQKNVLVEGLIVFAWSGLSAVLPIIIAYLENDPRWAVLIPVINAMAYAVKVTLKNNTLK